LAVKRLLNQLHRCTQKILNIFCQCARWIFQVITVVFSRLEFQMLIITFMGITAGFVFSSRVSYIHAFNAYDMNMYSYVQLVSNNSADKNIYEDIAIKYLLKSEDYRQAVARTTDMFQTSLFSIVFLFFAIVLTLIDKAKFKIYVLILVFISVCFFAVSLLLWYSPIELTIFQHDYIPGLTRNQPHSDFIDKLIDNTDYLKNALCSFPR